MSVPEHNLLHVCHQGTRGHDDLMSSSPSSGLSSVDSCEGCARCEEDLLDFVSLCFSSSPRHLLCLIKSTLALYLDMRLVGHSSFKGNNGYGKYFCSCASRCCCCWILFHRQKLCQGKKVACIVLFRNNNREIKQGSSVSRQKMLSEVKERAKTLQKPNLAPQLDGLECFETLVMI
ncbi:unnamed protein product [Sphenostylis stenocarpa]|uniref:Uncharacterized protein n=1 Tax=Sphenostylis stenocarpa TaxID=92480 RepID=A0AA86TPE0_9FABA|nr:unnamed protein product [Sphenostylis stenocarpa]